MSALPDLLRRADLALARRQALLADSGSDVARLVDSAGDGLPGLVVEKLGPVLIAQLYDGQLAWPLDTVRALCGHLADRVQARAVYRKHFPRDRSVPRPDLERLHRDPQPWIGVPVDAELLVVENGARFLVHPYDGYATGLYLDHRVQRALVRELSAGRRVLNAFAYTCGFAVAAALGGAAATSNVDVSKRHLEWGKRNLAANGKSLAEHRFYCCDIFRYYERAERRGERFDLVILDPPTFARLERPRRVFQLERDLLPLVGGAVRLLAPRGCLLVSANRGALTRRRLLAIIAAGLNAVGRRRGAVHTLDAPSDFRGELPEAARGLLVEVR